MYAFKLYNPFKNKELSIHYIKIVFPFFPYSGVACMQQTSYTKSLNEALKLAGSNREELKQVLDYYSQQECDSLKLEAAIFLIRIKYGMNFN